MDALLPVWPVAGVTPDELVAAIDRWVGSPAMTALVRHFGGEPPTGPLGARLASLVRFSEIWDGRKGGERIDATYAEPPPETDDLVRAVGRALGLTGRERPPRPDYDHVLILGGGIITGRARALFAAGLLAGGVTATTVCALGSLRQLAGDQPIATEGDAMLAGMVEAFPPDGEIVRHDGTTGLGHPWWVRRYPSGPLSVSVLAASPSRPGMRANTADTLVGWADLVVRPTPRDRLLLVTTDIYVPFQHVDAIRTLGLAYRCGIDTVGLDTTTFPDWPNPPSSVGQTLQEARSAICSMGLLYQSLR